MKVLQCIICLRVLLLIGVSLPLSAQVAETRKERSINNLLKEDGTIWTIEEAMEAYGLKGLSVAVVDNYQIDWTHTWGVKDTKTGTPINKETAFSTASISKPIAAVLLAILEEKGLIDLDAPVSHYLKRWQLPDNKFTRTVDITLKHLLSHTAGTTQHGFKDFYLGETIPSLVEVLEGGAVPGTSPMEVDFIPGSWWRYSGGGYVIAQIAVEDYLGKSLATLAEEHLFQPLALHHTTMRQDGEKGFLKNVAKVHTNQGEIIGTGIPICPQLAPSGMWSTPTDMALFVIEMQKALRGDKTQVISKEVATLVTRIVTTKVMGGWSLGWERRFGFGNHDWFSHGGSNTGTGGHVYATMEEGNAIVFFGNGPNEIRIPILDQLRNSIIKAHHWYRPLANLASKRAVEDDTAKKVSGRYVSMFGEIVEVYKEGKQLFISNLQGVPKAELIYLGDGTFLVDEFPSKIKFSPHPESKVLHIAFLKPASNIIDYPLRKLAESEKLPREYLTNNDYTQALSSYRSWMKENPRSWLVDERNLNAWGYRELNNNNQELAINIFKINVALYPKSANTYDSLGEAYLLNQQKKLAIKNYQKSLKLNPDNQHALEVLKKLKKQ